MIYRRLHRIFLLGMFLAVFSNIYAQEVDYVSFAYYNKRVREFAPLRDIDSTTIVMLGNSLTENGGNWRERIDTETNVVNRGIIGDNTVGMMKRLCQIAPYHPSAIFLMAGINDMSHGTPVQKVVNRVIALIDSIRVQAPGTKLFVESILPINETNGRWKSLSGRTDDIPVANMLIHAYCESLGITFVDIFSQLTSKHSNSLRSEFTTDGLHLNGEGYKVWASELHRYVERLEKQRRMPTIFDFLQPNYHFYEMNGDMNRGFLFKE